MVFKRNYRKRKPMGAKAKREVKKIVKRVNANLLLPSAGLAPKDGFPPSHSIKLKYFEVVTIDHGVGSANDVYAFNLNSIFRPNYTQYGTLSGLGGNHQPYYFDQLSGLYSRYIVTHVRYNVKLTDATHKMIVMVAEVPTLTFTYSNNPTTMVETWARYGRSKRGNLNTNLATHFVHSTKWISLETINKRPLDLEVDSASVSSSPVALSSLLVYTATTDGTTDQEVTLHIEIEYKVKLYDRVGVSGS